VVDAVNKEELLPVKIEGTDIDFAEEREDKKEAGEDKKKENAQESAVNILQPLGDWYAEVIETAPDGSKERLFECYGKTEAEVKEKCEDFEQREHVRRISYGHTLGAIEIKTKGEKTLAEQVKDVLAKLPQEDEDA